MIDDRVKKFVSSWLEEIAKLENQIIDERGASEVKKRFERDKINLEIGFNEHEYTTEEMQELDTIETRLILALEKARSNYTLKEKEIQAKNIENIRGIIQDILDKIPKPK